MMNPRRAAGLFGSSTSDLRVRLRFSRRGPAAAFSHIQQIDVLRRCLVKSPWPVSTTQGKKPKPKVSFGPAISVGYESDSEYCDAELRSRIDFAAAPADLAAVLPEGYALLSAKSIPRFFPSLEESVNVAEYEVESALFEAASPAWDAFAAKDRFLITKKKEDREVVIDARPVVRSWKLDGLRLTLQLRLAPGKTLKPERVAQAVCGLSEEQIAQGPTPGMVRVKRTHLYFEKDNGVLVEP
jgi:radical SAM-linked protein